MKIYEVSSICKYCGSTFVFNNLKKSLYCSKKCKKKSKSDLGVFSACNICSKSFKNFGEKFVCSINCLKKYLKDNEITIKNNNDFFSKMLSTIVMSFSKIVIKNWGLEIHIANNNDYCLKYLVYFENCESSFHFHKIKNEFWHCVCGQFDCLIQKGKKKKFLRIKEGDKLQIDKNTKHFIKAKENSIIVEVSTRDYPEDTKRIKFCPSFMTGKTLTSL